MSSPERQTQHERKTAPIDTSEQSRKIERSLEREHRPDHSIERAHEAHNRASEAALSSEQHRGHTAQEAEPVGPPTASKVKLDQSYKKTMRQVQTQLSAPERVFSKIIHSPIIEKTSDIIGSTVARPDAVLSGSVTALFVTLALYLTAKYVGFELTGSVTIAAFVAGWLIGIMFDLFKQLFRSKH